MRYRRTHVPGGTFFFTVNLADRSSCLLTEHVHLLRHSIGKVKTSHPFDIVAMVVLPDHLHTVWTLPEGDSNYPLRWSLIKAGFSRGLAATEPISYSRSRKRERGIWQRRYWEHLIHDSDDLARHVDYIHFNPAKHGYVDDPVEWFYSSIHRYIGKGVLPPDWAAVVSNENSCNFGEGS